MPKLQPAALWMLVSFTFGLSGCGEHQDASKGTSENGAAASQASLAEARKDTGTTALNLADGPDVCFRAVVKHLGANTQVSEISSFFSSGSEIDSSDRDAKGQMTTCSVKYQSPDDPRKLLSTSLNIRSGEFAPPSPVEITVTGGDAAQFKLEDYLIPLSKINAAGLTSIMEAQNPQMDSIYSRYAWSGVRLESPDSFSNVHTLRLDIKGRLASNDIQQSGYASVTTDGKTITANHLKP